MVRTARKGAALEFELHAGANRDGRAARIDRPVSNILIIKLRAVGDVVMATPVVANLRKAFPQAEIHFLTETSSVPVIEGNPDVDRVVELPLDRMAKLSPGRRLAAHFDFFKMLRAEGYDLVFDLFGNPRSAVLTRATGAPIRLGYDFRFRKWAYTLRVTPRGDRVHEVDFNLDSLRFLDLPVVRRDLVFPLDEDSREYVAGFLETEVPSGRRLFALNCAGGWGAKRWPISSYAHLADQIHDELEGTVILIWGPGELEQVREIERLARHPVTFAPPTSLKQLGALLARCDILVSNDSGPMHIAAAVGTPVVGIYGPTNPVLQGPFGTEHRIVRNETLDCLGCNHTTCPLENTPCMNALPVSHVFEAVVDLRSERDRAAVLISPGAR